jgi:hypothetical protein
MCVFFIKLYPDQGELVKKFYNFIHDHDFNRLLASFLWMRLQKLHTYKDDDKQYSNAALLLFLRSAEVEATVELNQNKSIDRKQV